MVIFKSLIVTTLSIFAVEVSSTNTYVFRSEEIVNKFNRYIAALSETKPIKCSVEIPNSVRSQKHSEWILSERCRNGDNWKPFIYKGIYDDQDRLSGPGKLTVTSYNDAVLSEDINFNTCLQFPTKFESGAHITSIIGTFVDGTLHGSSKVVFSDGTFVITRFEKGVPLGLMRVFHSNKKLLSASVVHGSSEIGFTWRAIRGNYSYVIDHKHTADSYKSGRMSLYNSLVIDLYDFSIVGGEYMEHVDLLYNPYAPYSIEFNLETEDCIKYPIWKKSKVDNGSVYSIRLKSLIENLTPPNHTLPQNSVPKRLNSFNKYINSEPEIFMERSRLLRSPSKSNLKTPFITDVRKKSDEGSYEAILMDRPVNISLINGLLDENQLFHGYTRLALKTKVPLNTVYVNISLSQINCHFIHGTVRDGLCSIILDDKRPGKITIESNSLHGPMLIDGVIHTLPIVQIGRTYILQGRSSIFYYENGKNVGNFWVSMLGKGVLTGKLNETGYVTGDRISYIYPDMETSYVGKFENKLMKEAYLGDVRSLTFDQKGFPVIGFKMSKEETRPFYYDPPTNESTGAGPHILDPFDQKRVYLSEAGELGEGVHAKVDMEVGDIACLYSYYIYYLNDLYAYQTSCSMNTTKTDDERRHCRKYSLSVTYTKATVNIPPDQDVAGTIFPTLGPKLNHKFYESPASFADFESPRWGIVSSIAIHNRDVKKDEQLFVDYGYTTRSNFPSDFPWYWELKDKVDKERRIRSYKKSKKKSKEVKRKKSFEK